MGMGVDKAFFLIGPRHAGRMAAEGTQIASLFLGLVPRIAAPYGTELLRGNTATRGSAAVVPIRIGCFVR